MRPWAILAAMAAALSAGPAPAGPPGIPGGPAGETAPATDLLLNCYRTHLRQDRLTRLRRSDSLDLLKRSLNCGLDWVVLEPDDPKTSVRAAIAIEALMDQMWRDRRLQGDVPREAFYVQCGQSVATEQDRAQALMVCRIGAATKRPGEFEVLTISKRTADSP